MRKYIWLLCLCLMACLSGCFDDDSTVATEANRAHEIKVEGLPQDTSAVAFSSVLELTPVVEGFADDELLFNWYIYGGQFGQKGEYRKNKIWEGKKLAYPVELKIGKYSVICEATHKETGYFGLVEFSLDVTSAFSNGFYALKETAEGNTELDFYNYRDTVTLNDLLTENYGAPLNGKPRNMNPVYKKIHMDSETATSTYATGMFLAYGENNFAVYNTVDMSLMFDRSSLFYATMEEDEIPYAMATTGEYNHYFSNKGICYESVGGGFFASEYATGKLVTPEGCGGSTFVQAFNGRELSYWSESKHCLMCTDGREIGYKDGYAGVRVPFEKAEAIATGWNWNSGDNAVWYLFDVKDDGRYLVILGKETISEVCRLDAEKLASAAVIAGKGLRGSFIYSVKDNQLYRYSMKEKVETALSVASLPAGTVTYMSNLFYEAAFDYLVIGVQNGGKYTVVMYEMQGGQPFGEPKHTFEGTGILKKLCYAVPMSDYSPMSPNLYAFLYPDSMSPTFPY